MVMPDIKTTPRGALIVCQRCGERRPRAEFLTVTVRPKGSAAPVTMCRGLCVRCRIEPKPGENEETWKCTGCGKSKVLSCYRQERKRLVDGTLVLHRRGECRECASREAKANRAHPALHKKEAASHASWRARRTDAYKEAYNARRRVLYALGKRDERHSLAPKYIDAACAAYLITTDDLLGPSREAQVTEARALLAYIFVTILMMSNDQAGEALHRDRATVHHHVQSLRRHRTDDQRSILRDLHIAVGGGVRYLARETRCLYGHPLPPRDSSVHLPPSRRCPQCEREKDARYRARRREAKP
jgi:hypothetical protein